MKSHLIAIGALSCLIGAGCDTPPSPPPPGYFNLTTEVPRDDTCAPYTDGELVVDAPGIGPAPAIHYTLKYGSPAKTISLPQGTQVTLRAQKSPGELQQFLGFSGSCSGTQETCVLTMDADKSVTATFCALIR